RRARPGAVHQQSSVRAQPHGVRGRKRAGAEASPDPPLDARRRRPRVSRMSHPHRIATIEPVLVEVPMKAPTHGVHGTVSTQRSALVRVVSDQGAEGWGNVDPTAGYSLTSVDDIVATMR